MSCQEEVISTDSSLRLSFSRDTIRFDTIFTNLGTSTQQVMVYNKNKNAVVISEVQLEGKYFHINLDGENQVNRLKDIQLNGGDSLFLFIRAKIDPLDENTPVLVTDTIRFSINGNEQCLPIEAYGQDVTVICTPEGKTRFTLGKTLTNERPYLIYDTIEANGPLKIEAGTTLYMHKSAAIIANNSVTAIGTKETPIRILGDRTDYLFDSVPYRVASGQWVGIYLFNTSSVGHPQYQFDHVEVLSGNIGIYCESADKNQRGHLSLHNSRIHNHAIYGVVLLNTDAEIVNTEISNCAAYCLYLAGGTQQLIHNTIVSYFGWPHSDLNIHSVSREDAAAVYIDNLDKNQVESDVSIKNCIITGDRKNNLVIATLLPDYYGGEIYGNFIKSDSIHAEWCHDNVYEQESDTTLFVNAYYKYHEYKYFDFQLDSLSPARAVGDSLVGELYPLDRNGNKRNGKKPDAGCYQL